MTPARRGRGARGTSMVTALVLMFAFTAGGVIWLARDVDRAVSNRSSAQAIAFQAARSGAQQVVVGGLRDDALTVVVDVDAARGASAATAAELFGEYGVDGRVTGFVVGPVDTVTVTVQIDDAGISVTGVGSARAEQG